MFLWLTLHYSPSKLVSVTTFSFAVLYLPVLILMQSPTQVGGFIRSVGDGYLSCQNCLSEVARKSCEGQGPLQKKKPERATGKHRVVTGTRRELFDTWPLSSSDCGPSHGGPAFSSLNDSGEWPPHSHYQYLHCERALAGRDAETWNWYEPTISSSDEGEYLHAFLLILEYWTRHCTCTEEGNNIPV